jgi:hypothetical protein
MREVVIAGGIIWLIWELRWLFLAIVILDFIRWCFVEIGQGIAAVFHAIASVFRYFATQNRIWLLAAFAGGGMLTEFARDSFKTRYSTTNRNPVRIEPYLDAPITRSSSNFLPPKP